MSKGAGRYRHYFTLQQPVKSRDAGGGEVVTWSTVGKVWGEKMDLRGREYLASREVRSEVTTKIRIRHRSDITVEWRLVLGSRTFDVQHTVDLQGRTRELELMCSEIS